MTLSDNHEIFPATGGYNPLSIELSGSTLKSTGYSEVDPVILKAAEDYISDEEEPHCRLSTDVYYADFDFEQSEDEHSWLIFLAEEAATKVDEECDPPSPSVYYDDLHFESSEDERERLIQAAEEEDMGLGPETKAMSPTNCFESSSPLSENRRVCQTLLE